MLVDPAPIELDFDLTQPYAMWDLARREAPVVEIPPSEEPGGRATFMVARYADCEQVLRDHETYSSSINAESMGPVMGELILAMDGVEHRQYRDLVAKAFRSSMLAHWEQELIGPILDGLLDEIAPLGRADLVRDVTSKYPVQVIAGIVGVPLADHEQFQEWAEAINKGPTDFDASLPASQAMREYLTPIVEDRKRSPSGDLISELVTAEVDGQRLTDEKIYGFLRLLLPAGAETTYRVMGNALAALLQDPAVLSAARRDPDVLPEVIEETLRWETSVTMVNRVTTRATELSGVSIPVGSSILVLTGSSNRDDARFERGDVWELGRPSGHHLAFGTGRHQCLGMHLARLELRTGLQAILDRLPNLRLDPNEPPPRIEGFAFRGPATLPVLFG